jgi:O-succinylbenzoate synthase
VVGIETADGALGWGECSALNAPTYTHEWAADSFERLAAWAHGGSPPPADSFPMAAAAIEMAGLDATLRQAGDSLARALGADESTTVPAGATIGLADMETSVAEANHLVASGYRRLKIKIDPTQVDAVPHELSHLYPSDGPDRIELQVDANGSLDAGHLMALLGLTWHGVSAIEQPFPIDRPDLAAELMLGTDAIVVADEAVTGMADAQRLREQSAMRAVAIKPPRLGGIGPAVELLEWCATNGVGASIGGMLESGLGRHALVALAALDGFTMTGDVSPARQWLAEDPWPDIDLVDGAVPVPTEPGVAPLPDPQLLDQFTVRLGGRRG